MLHDLNVTMNVVLPYFLMIMIGYAVRNRVADRSGTASIASSFIFRIAMPCKLFVSMYTADQSLKMGGNIYLLITAILLGTLLLSIPVVRHTCSSPHSRGVLVQNAYRSNYLIFGTAIAEEMYGVTGTAAAAGLGLIVIPLFNILSVIVLSVYDDDRPLDSKRLLTVLRKILTNPLLLGIVAGYLCRVLHIPIFSFILKTGSSIGACSSPVAFLMLGLVLDFGHLKNNRSLVLQGTLTRLVIVPAITLPICILVGYRNEMLLVLLLAVASPVAVSSSIMAQEMGGDGELAGELVISSSFFGMFTILAFLFILRRAGLVV